MAVDFQQTDTNVGGTLPIPTGALPLNPLTTMYKRMVEGGTAGTAGITITTPNNDARSAIGFETLVNVPDSGSVWTAGTFTVRLTLTSGSKKIFWTHAHACRMNSAGVIQEVIGSNAAVGLNLRAPSLTTFTTTITVSASPLPLQTDRLYIVYGLTNTHNAASVSIVVQSSAINTVHWVLAAGARTFIVGPVTTSCVLVAPVVKIPRTFVVTPVHAQLVLVAPTVSIPRTFTVGPVTTSLTLVAPTVLQGVMTFTVPPVTMSCTLLSPTVLGGAGVLKIRVGANWIVTGGQT